MVCVWQDACVLDGVVVWAQSERGTHTVHTQHIWSAGVSNQYQPNSKTSDKNTYKVSHNLTNRTWHSYVTSALLLYNVIICVIPRISKVCADISVVTKW